MEENVFDGQVLEAFKKFSVLKLRYSLSVTQKTHGERFSSNSILVASIVFL